MNNDQPPGDTKKTKKLKKWSVLWTTKDYWPVWIGFSLIIFTLLMNSSDSQDEIIEEISWANAVMQTEQAKAPFKTVGWYEAFENKAAAMASDKETEKVLQQMTATPHQWEKNLWTAFYQNEFQAYTKNQQALKSYKEEKKKAAIALSYALHAENRAASVRFSDPALNKAAQEKIKEWRKNHLREKAAQKRTENKAYNIFFTLTGLMIFISLFFMVAQHKQGRNPISFFGGFIAIFLLAVFAHLIAAQSSMYHYGISYPAWGIIVGLLISNTIGTPEWIKPAIQVELYIKTGLVLLGAEILLNKVISIGIPGIFVAWGGTLIVLITTFWFGQRVLKMESKTLNIVISADMSVCGTSAAIATAAACKAKKEELTFAIGLSLIFTSIMMILMPIFIGAVHMNEVLAGAWLGGTIDATGAVAAAAALVSERTMYVAATIKMIQNILIGIVAFCVAMYWSIMIEKKSPRKISMMEIWWVFPKFIIGFIAASLIFSLLYTILGHDAGYVIIERRMIHDGTKLFRGWFFCLSFVSIGLEYNFREMKKYFKGGKPLILYIFGQSLQLALSLLLAYLAFFILFPDITKAI